MKNKKTIKHHLKRQLHPNRWFIWTLVLLLISGFTLLSFIKWTSLRIDSDSAFSELRPKKIYTDPSGYTVRYPSSWALDRDSAGNVALINPENNDESLVILATKLSEESTIRKSIKIKTEEDVARDNLKIALINIKDNSVGSLNAAIITSKTKLYYIYGHSTWLETIARNFKAE